VDAVEVRGFEYHTGICFTLFARRARGELGRGGRYLAGEDLLPSHGEPATGFTLFMDTILQALSEPAPRRMLFLPFGTTPAVARKWRAEGWTTLAGLEAGADAATEAKRQGCSHVLVKDAPREV
jgi:ATP phosphoribosyltransferase regulatory subunit